MLKNLKYLSEVTLLIFILFGCQQQYSTDPVEENAKLLKPGGSALSFDGIDDYVNVPHDVSLNATDELTISAWVYFDGEYPIEYSSIVTKGDNAGTSTVNNNYTLHSSGGGGFYLTATTSGGGGFQFVSANSPLSLDTWHHIAVTFNFDGADGEAKFYIDGSFINSVTSPLDGELLPNDAPLTIGVDFPISAEFWKGKIDEVKIWNETLSESQVISAMGAATPRAISLMGYWRFNDGSGLTARDRSRNHNHGSLVGGATWTFPGAI
jgi:hypothetical protein